MHFFLWSKRHRTATHSERSHETKFGSVEPLAAVLETVSVGEFKGAKTNVIIAAHFEIQYPQTPPFLVGDTIFGFI